MCAETVLGADVTPLEVALLYANSPEGSRAAAAEARCQDYLMEIMEASAKAIACGATPDEEECKPSNLALEFADTIALDIVTSVSSTKRFPSSAAVAAALQRDPSLVRIVSSREEIFKTTAQAVLVPRRGGAPYRIDKCTMLLESPANGPGSDELYYGIDITAVDGKAQTMEIGMSALQAPPASRQ